MSNTTILQLVTYAFPEPHPAMKSAAPNIASTSTLFIFKEVNPPPLR